MNPKQSDLRSLPAERRRRRAAAAVIRRLFPDLQGVSKRLRYAVSRARNGQADPLYRLVDLLVEARLAGASREQAAAVPVHLMCVVEELWGEDRQDPAAALLAEQEIDGREDVVQLRAMENPALRLVWAEVAEEHISRSIAAIAAIRRAHARRAAA